MTTYKVVGKLWSHEFEMLEILKLRMAGKREVMIESLETPRFLKIHFPNSLFTIFNLEAGFTVQVQ